MRFIDKNPFKGRLSPKVPLENLVELAERVQAAVEALGADSFCDLEIKLTPIRGDDLLLALVKGDKDYRQWQSLRIPIPAYGEDIAGLHGEEIELGEIGRKTTGHGVFRLLYGYGS
ncbi:MAG: hypothetical protein P0Y64_05635 [Candidatus Sphingomonas colombiensis]|nr:hypothetical protein [Sphingomonas sp.]WEK44290.1 MAG: hypothetical protein P0Y64_05635 [Sphingomonas sp.]